MVGWLAGWLLRLTELPGNLRGQLPVSFSKMATMPTPSMSLPLGRVRRSADSHVRVTPFGSLYVFLRRMSEETGRCGETVGLLPVTSSDSLHQSCPHRIAVELDVHGWPSRKTTQNIRCNARVGHPASRTVTYERLGPEHLGFALRHGSLGLLWEEVVVDGTV